MQTIQPARIRPNASVDALPTAPSPEGRGAAADGLIRGQALIFWDPKVPGRKLDAIDTDQITPSTDCISESLERLDERWKAGSFRYLMPDFRDRVARGQNFIVAGVLGIAVVGIYHVRRDRSLGLTARPGRGKAYAIVALATLVLLVAGAALALANGIGPLIAVSLGLLFLASLERRREYAALAMLLAVVAVAPVTLLPQPEAFVVSTLAFGAVLTVAGVVLFRSRG